jgi:PAS domain S-box-containing protein
VALPARIRLEQQLRNGSTGGSQSRRRRLAHYAVALGCAAAAVFARYLFDPILGESLPFVTLFGAVAVAVWFGGWRPALLTALVGYAAVGYLIVLPRPPLTSAAVWIGFVAYVLSCSLIIYLGEAMRRATEQLRRQIVERKQVETALATVKEETLRISEARVASIIASAMDAIITVDQHQRIVVFNRAAERIFGCSADEGIGQALDRFIPERFRNLHRQHIATFGHTGVTGRSMSRPGILYGLRASGEEFPIEATISQIESDGQKFYTVILRDVTERAQADEVRQQLAAIVESTEDAIISKTLDGTITTWNAGAEYTYGYSAQEVIGKSMALLSPPDRQGELPALLDKLKQGLGIAQYETVRQRKHGGLVDVSITVSPIHDEQGRIAGAATIARDISERKRAEEMLRKSEKLAAAGRMAATVAHEINNPLEAVVNLWYLLGNEHLSPKAREYLTMAGTELGRVANIAKQALSFYRKRPHPASLNVCQVLEEVINLMGLDAQSRGVKFLVEYTEPCFVQGYADEMGQLFSNLVRNAVEAESRTVKIRVSAGHSWKDSHAPGVRITISDDGKGIARDHLHHLFEPFYTTKDTKGTGLGLWVSNGIVAKHEGQISVRSSTREGRSGTAFSIFLPSALAKSR